MKGFDKVCMCEFMKGVPQEFLESFSSDCPVIVDGLLLSETAMGFITARVKRPQRSRSTRLRALLGFSDSRLLRRERIAQCAQRQGRLGDRAKEILNGKPTFHRNPVQYR